ncbi:MAG TPA: UDP-N-acetylglucosamine 1-carboxyvinyltransferase [Dehalococcoidia bacterium]|nr:UDP-N-acetylglucosamine 1-carboxyvinyltransferase [Dehalococcoidia bacterium]
MSSPNLVIEGGRPLQGTVRVSGSKNAADYALAACLLTEEECVLENVPDIEDVRLMARILASLGASVQNEGGGVWRVRAAAIDHFDAPSELAVNQRASFLVMGPLLARFGSAACASPGGDVIGARPLDVHLAGFRALGASVRRENEQYRAEADSGRLQGTRFFLDYPSVTGTMNLVFAASLARGRTTLINAAAEPEIVNVIDMLNAMGARIRTAGSGVLEIEGVARLSGVRHRVIPDRLEAGLFALATAATRGDAVIEGAAPQHLDALLYKMREAGVSVEPGERSIRVCGAGRRLRAVQAQAVPYPGLATDLHPPLAAFLTQCEGVSIIQERVYENRLLYISELRKMGAELITAGQTALITGPTQLYGAKVRALDVRAGGSLVLAGLVASGRTEISDVFHLDRAHEDLVGKLRGLGASVER